MKIDRAQQQPGRKRWHGEQVRRPAPVLALFHVLHLLSVQTLVRTESLPFPDIFPQSCTSSSNMCHRHAHTWGECNARGSVRVNRVMTPRRLFYDMCEKLVLTVKTAKPNLKEYQLSHSTIEVFDWSVGHLKKEDWFSEL